MNRFPISDKNELIQICIVYRYFSLAISTFVYFFSYGWDITLIRLAIATGMVSACLIGTYVYKTSFSQNTQTSVGIVICMEVVAYGLFIIVSGGFSSPYLWYFISSLTIVMAAGRIDTRFRILTPLATIWCFICAVAGSRYGLPAGYSAHVGINTGIAFLLVSGGFYTLFVYVDKLDNRQQQLDKLNKSLQVETQRSEETLRHTLDIYESFNLFGITDPNKVMDELTALLYRTIAPNGCLLLKINMLQKIENTDSRGLSPKEESALIEYAAQLQLAYPQTERQGLLEVCDSRYTINYISNISGIQGMLIRPFKEGDAQSKQDNAQELFYLNLVGIIMQELDLHNMVESYIISEEQNRIANEIHDTVIQKLFAIVCNLRVLDEKQGNISAAEHKEQLRQIMHAVESTMRELREAIYGLRWENGGHSVFVDKLTAYLDEVRYLSGATINLVFDGDVQFMTVNQKTTLYRIICEAVNNAIHHGKATEVDVLVELNEEQLSAEIRDNGKGFDQRRYPAEGQGLKNMYSLTNLLKGQLLLESQIGAGTVIKCILPK